MNSVSLEEPRVLPQESSPRRPNTRVLMVAGAAIALAAAGVVWMRLAPSSVATDNAYLKADSTLVSTRVRGLVAEVLVAENAQVRPGQPLLRLDSPDYVARLAAAQSELAKAEAQVAAARAALARGYAEGDLAQSVVRQVATDITVAQAQSARARADLSRYDTLVSDGTVARREAEKVRADAIGAEAALERSRAALAVSRAQAVATERRQGELAAAVAAADAELVRARSALDLARRDEADTLVRAPVAGIVGDRKVNPGDYIQPGARLLTIVPTRGLYVTANFKETQTPRLLVGQPATVKVDALPGVALRARVQSVSPASGAEFALLPFEPGTGNFTKIVQRVPVRLTFEAGQPEVARLRPGLSVRVKVSLADDAAN